MALRLILMRHAKSAWDDPLTEDFDRPLNGRGRASSTVIGAWLVRHGYLPDQVLSSSSKRTRETWEGLGLTCPRARFTERLYRASAEAILEELRAANGTSVLLLAHNPGIAEFAARFANHPRDDTDFRRYPTTATAVFDIAADRWSDVRFGVNKLRDFVCPQDLL
ncbi:Histidine phosphatase superfamily (branch 1) [Aquimixticola soesokkakensis]|uniref:Histidine phosphatase superfamily (Branch 1) n=1 Tax=Aquimixticola soesokkakensis TaxID=1519096 RepID=A0A1Y5SZ65_9RHOB|nr:histidine phosphatase family protein [Aquimixticola soesokkakensis]SLN51715.1 Histidine phosphatase superfamily (branch 1) [Aquimixticola soesokkakensis]